MTSTASDGSSTDQHAQAFVLAHVLLSAPPALLFIVFSTSVLVTSLVTTFLTALVLALSFTAFCTGLALLVLLPTLLITTITATLLFLGGLIVYLILHKFNNDPRTEAIRTKSKESILYSKDRASEGIDGLLKSVIALSSFSLLLLQNLLIPSTF